MRCRRCGKELKDSVRCSFCGYEENVREMTSAEKNFYNGVTIDVDADEKNHNRRHDSEHTSYGSTFIHFGSISPIEFLLRLLNGLFGGSLLTKIIAGVLFIVFAAFMFFVALPIFFVVIAVGIFVLVILPRLKSKIFGRR